MNLPVGERLAESSRWRARDITYWGGSVERIFPLMPRFKMEEFTAGEGSVPNPHLKAVVRQPMSLLEKPIAVGVVSNQYRLAQHHHVAEKCLDGLRCADVDKAQLRCELGLTDLGEWMNLRLYFPASYDYNPGDGNPLGLRLECFNAVDGTHRLVILLGWLRFVCSNGMVIGETRAEIREVHNTNLDLDAIPFVIEEGMAKVDAEKRRLQAWARESFTDAQLAAWADKTLTEAWGKKAACRAFHICRTGRDVDLDNPFAPGPATAKPVRYLESVPGAATPAKTLYEVSQALSWIATKRKDAEDRLKEQGEIPALIAALKKA